MPAARGLECQSRVAEHALYRTDWPSESAIAIKAIAKLVTITKSISVLKNFTSYVAFEAIAGTEFVD